MTWRHRPHRDGLDVNSALAGQGNGRLDRRFRAADPDLDPAVVLADLGLLDMSRDSETRAHPIDKWIRNELG
jgi:hypothetical protein